MLYLIKKFFIKIEKGLDNGLEMCYNLTVRKKERKQK